MTTTVQDLLMSHRDGAHVAIKDGDLSRSWGEYLDDAEVAAAALLDMTDPRRPLHIGVLLGNTTHMLVHMAAAALGGYVLVGINTTRRGQHLAADIHRADCQILVVDDEHESLLAGLDVPDILVVNVASPTWESARAAAASPVPRGVAPEDTFMMIFTSGTSGDPKAVCVSHQLVSMSAQLLAQRFELAAEDTCYLSMPLFHSNGVIAGWSVAVAAGAAMVPTRFSASGFLPDIRRYGVTYMNYVGKPLAHILAVPKQADDADNTLRVAFGNEGSDADISEFGRRFGAHVWDGFGSTECAVIITREPGTPAGSVGKGFPGVAIYDSDGVVECPAARFDSDGRLMNRREAVGELVNTEGAGPFNGYYNDPQSTAARTRHGMYWSGDLAYRDADGWIYLAGRTADWMRVAGENIGTAPLERILLRCKAINRVAVYGVPDEGVGDQIMAAIVLQPDTPLTPGAFEEFLGAQVDLPPMWWPRYLRLTTELPSTATFKVIKRELIACGATPGDDEIWIRRDRGNTFEVFDPVGC